MRVELLVLGALWYRTVDLGRQHAYQCYLPKVEGRTPSYVPARDGTLRAEEPDPEDDGADADGEAP